MLMKSNSDEKPTEKASEKTPDSNLPLPKTPLWLRVVGWILLAVATAAFGHLFWSPGQDTAALASYVATPQPTPPPTPSPTPVPTPVGMTSSGLINLNIADAPALMTLPGIAEKRAAAIIAERQANGPFASVADLSRVTGLPANVIADITPLVCVSSQTP